MFGRYACSFAVGTLTKTFRAEPPQRSFTPTWNLSPGHEAPVVRLHSRSRSRLVDVRQWGWEDEQQRGGRLKYEVEAEEIEGDDVLMPSARFRRCLVPAEAFYIWREQPSGKKAFAAGRYGVRRMMALAGLWRLTDGLRGETPTTFAVITVPATGVAGVLQKRMPVMVDEADWPLWLGEVDGNFRSVLEGASDFGLHVWQVNRKVSHQDADGWELLNGAYEISPGDPLTCFRLTSCEIEASRAHLERVQRRYVAAMTGKAATQQAVAYEATALAAADCLAAASRVCADLGGQKMPRDPFRDDDNALTNCFGHRMEIVRLGAALRRLNEVVRVWPHCQADDYPWPAPDTIATLCRENPAFESLWGRCTGFGALSSLRAMPREFEKDFTPIGPCDLVGAAESMSEMAYAIVVSLEAAAVTAPDVGAALSVPDPMPPGFIAPGS